MSSHEAPPILGHIEIYIDGYRPNRRDMAHFFYDLKTQTLTGGPDATMPSHQFEVGSEEWWEQGWAIGANRSNVPCLRTCGSDLKRFMTFDEATAAATARQRSHPDQRHVLVYVLEDNRGFENRFVINSALEIAEIDTQSKGRRK